MENYPLVSVIVPNYNHAKYLDERIQSILNQTYQNFELIILDDYSSDNSIEVINKYKSNPHLIDVIVNEENSGKVFSQWQKGINIAKGEFVWIAESDDKCKPDLLEKLVSEFIEDSNLVLSFSRTVMFDDKGYESISYGAITHTNIERMSGGVFISKYMVEGCYVTNASSALFKKSAAVSIDRQYADYKGAGDRLFWIEIAECGNVAIINEPLNYCRRHGDNITSSNQLYGILHLEDKKILDYIYERKYISFFRRIITESSYIYNNILDRNFATKSIKNNVLRAWNYNYVRKILIGLFYFRFYLAKIIK